MSSFSQQGAKISSLRTKVNLAHSQFDAALSELEANLQIVIIAQTTVAISPFRQRQRENPSEAEIVIVRRLAEAGTGGYFLKDLRKVCQLPTKDANDATKTLINENIIKKVPTVKSKKLRLYMLFMLEPSIEHTGGAFYNRGEFDSGYVYAVKAKLIEMMTRQQLRDKSSWLLTVPAILQWYDSSQISSVPLNEESMRELLNSMVYEGLLVEYNNCFFPLLDMTTCPKGNQEILDDCAACVAQSCNSVYVMWRLQ
ncbi:hypothetical protein PCE1_000778 [Barthelona sp. PCE]